jgi:subtilisin
VASFLTEGKETVRVNVLFRGGSPEPALARAEARRARVRHRFRLIPAANLEVPASQVASLLEDLDADPDVLSVEPDPADHRLFGQVTPWGISAVEADVTRRTGKRGKGVKVCVIDTGIDYTHPDLAGRYQGGRDFVNGDSNPWDDHGHGTHVSGTIAAVNNSLGVVGVAPQAQILAAKTFDADGYGTDSDFIAALEWCIDQGARVANYSAGSYRGSSTVEKACDSARKAGLTVVAAAGNYGTSALAYPARYDSVISVGAVNKGLTRAAFSQYGPGLDLVAPGVAVTSTLPGKAYGSWDGTSMATPHVTGVAALLAGTGMRKPEAIQGRLTRTAVDLGGAGWNRTTGYGMVQAYQAVYYRRMLTAPAGGEELTRGAVTDVVWNSQAGAATYRICFSPDGGETWTTVAENLVDTLHAWTVPDSPGGTCRLRVEAFDAEGKILGLDLTTAFTIL